MSVATRALKRIQETRAIMKSKTSNDPSYIEGYIDGLEYAEDTIYAEQKFMHGKIVNEKSELWKTGSPDSTGDYIVIIKSNFNGDGVEKDKIYISTDYWNGREFESLILGDGEWEVLYFAKLISLHFPMPIELGVKKHPDMFLD